MRCLARRRAPVIRTPSNPRTNSSNEGCSTRAGSSTSAISILAPTTSSRRSFFMVSTSGSSGIYGVVMRAVSEWGRLPVDGLVEPVEHYRAGIEGAHSALAYYVLTLLVFGV